ncbi:MAG: magnesium chelatase ATPase subunit I [Acidobacteriota bacterium]|nr:magnesium chelatase ATPase subunit I [Acidobacteriota bacterium]
MKLGLILNVIDPSIGGVLIMGHRGTGKSTAVRGLAELLPEVWVAKRCAYRCDPSDMKSACDACREQLASEKKLERERAQVAVVDLPLGATEDRVCGSIDIQRALTEGVKAFEPGLLARANRGFLYIDEVNLLGDHLVDLLLDVAVTGQNRVERENISVTHPARFVLIGSGNPEEGELRPQLLDRFGLNVEVKTETELADRVEIVERREAFQGDEENFVAAFAAQQTQLRKQIIAAQKHVGTIKVERPLLHKIAELCGELGIDGHRGELTISRAARALAAFEGKKKVGTAEIKRVAALALRHRLRRDPLEERAESERIQQAIEKTFSGTQLNRSDRSGDDGNEGGRGKKVKPDDSSSAQTSRDRRRVASASGAETADKTTSVPFGDLKHRDVRLPNMPQSRRDLRSDSASQRNRRAGAISTRNHLRGRYVRATATRNDNSRVAVAATLRASVSSGVARLKTTNRRISPDSLRFQELSCKTGRLFIFAIDTSGSMALHRIKQAKIAVLSLLRQSYIQRDQVAIIGFRGESTEVCLPVSRSILRARRVLDSLRVGGGTPLSAGLACALKLAKAAGTKVGETSVLLFTDGNANVAFRTNATSDRRARQETIDQELAMLGSAFRKERVSLTVMDTQNTFIRSGEAATVAKRLGAQYRSLKGYQEQWQAFQPERT